MARTKLPPLNSLRAFEVAGRRLNFRAAAEELGVTQGAVSQQVRGLEDHVGAPLFHRLPRGLSLTPRGALYLVEVSRAFRTLSEATDQLFARPNVVTLSTTPTFGGRLLIPRLHELQALHPDIELRAVATESISDFERDDVDIAIRFTKSPFPAGQEAEFLFHQDIIAVANPRLLKGHKLPMSSKDLHRLPLLHDSHDLWRRFLEEEQQRPGPKFNPTTLAIDAALAGQGVALICKAFVEGDLAAGRLKQVMTKTMRMDSAYYLVRKKTAVAPEAVDTIWHWCLSQWGPSGEKN